MPPRILRMTCHPSSRQWKDHPHFIVPYQQESKQLTLNISHHATDGLILGVHYDVEDPLCSSHPAIYGWMAGYLLL